MKTNKLQFFTLLALGGLMVIAPIARADDTTPATPPPAAGGGPGGRPNQRAMMEKLFTAISATDAQKEQLKPIFKERDEKIKALRDDTSAIPEDKRTKRKEIMDDTATKVKGVLSADQFTKYETFMKEQMGRGRRGQQPPPPGNTSTNN